MPGNAGTAPWKKATTDPGSAAIASTARHGNAVVVPDWPPTHGAGSTAPAGEPSARAAATSDRPSACSGPGIATMDEPPGDPNATGDQPSARGAESGVTMDEPSGRDAASSDSAPVMAESTSAIEAFRTDAWIRQDPRLPDDFAALTPEWRWEYTLRTPEDRHAPSGTSGAVHDTQETDPAMPQTGITLGWEDIRDLPEGAVVTRRITDDTLPGGPTTHEIVYHAPFDRTVREEDQRLAWTTFDLRFRGFPADLCRAHQ